MNRRLKSEVTIKPLSREDAAMVPRLIEGGLRPDVFHCTVFSCPGYPAYLRSLIQLRPEFRPNRFFGAYSGGRLLGFTEWRSGNGAFLLNSIFVNCEDRGSGIGRQLFQHGKLLAQRCGFANLQLDVFEYNEPAMLWYLSLGFKLVSQSYWSVGENPLTDGSSAATAFLIPDFPQAEAAQKSYGFSHLRICTQRGETLVGRLHSGYFRIVGADSLQDIELLAGLNLLDPRRSFLVVTDTVLDMPNFEKITICNRLELRLGNEP